MNRSCDFGAFGGSEVERSRLAGHEHDVARLAAEEAVTGNARRCLWFRRRLDIDVECEPYAPRAARSVRFRRRIVGVRWRAHAEVYDIETRRLSCTKINEAEFRR